MSVTEFKNAGLLIRVRSQHLDDVVFFASNNAVVPPDIDRGRVYYADELYRLIERDPTPGELRRMHATKQLFSGSIA